MYNLNHIRNILKGYIDRGIDKYIIYPFGMNGVSVKNILKDYFNLEPCLIVDNEASKYNPVIINFAELKRVYQEDMYVIVTIENDKTNTEMMSNLSNFIPSEHIVNLKLCEEKEKKDIYDGKGFMLADFLPLSKIATEDKKEADKIKVRIVHRSSATWNTISTICQAFKDDSLFDLLLIVHTDWTREQSIRQIEGGGYEYVTWDDYSVESDRPDILVIGLPWFEVIDGLINSREYVKLIVAAYWSVVRYDASMEEFRRRLKNTLGIFRPDYYLFDSLQYKEIRESDFFSDQIIEMGNAKFDGIYHANRQERKYVKGWEKLKGKRVILWVTSHGIVDRIPGRSLTFDLYAKTVFEYLDGNSEVGLIFRPSIGFIKEVIQYGYWSQSDLKRFIKYCDDSSNIVFDDTDTYDISYSLADGILTEAFCGSVCSALPMLKPICACYRSKSDIPWHKELMDSLYSAYTNEDIVNFFEMIKNRQDPMLELRKKSSEKFVKHFDGKNGWRIKEFIKEKYFEMM